jgi:hypothetical protein
MSVGEQMAFKYRIVARIVREGRPGKSTGKDWAHEIDP